MKRKALWSGFQHTQTLPPPHPVSLNVAACLPAWLATSDVLFWATVIIQPVESSHRWQLRSLKLRIGLWLMKEDDSEGTTRNFTCFLPGSPWDLSPWILGFSLVCGFAVHVFLWRLVSCIFTNITGWRGLSRVSEDVPSQLGFQLSISLPDNSYSTFEDCFLQRLLIWGQKDNFAFSKSFWERLTKLSALFAQEKLF